MIDIPDDKHDWCECCNHGSECEEKGIEIGERGCDFGTDKKCLGCRLFHKENCDGCAPQPANFPVECDSFEVFLK